MPNSKRATKGFSTCSVALKGSGKQKQTQTTIKKSTNYKKLSCKTVSCKRSFSQKQIFKIPKIHPKFSHNIKIRN